MSSNWLSKNNKLSRVFNFDDFKTALVFVNQVAALAESANHHPDITIHYNKVILELSTHTAAAVTKKDFDLAKKIDNLI